MVQSHVAAVPETARQVYHKGMVVSNQIRNLPASQFFLLPDLEYNDRTLGRR